MKVYIVFQNADDPYSGGDWFVDIFLHKEDAVSWIGDDENFYFVECEVK